MNIVGCLDRPTTGSYRLDGVEMARESREALADLRNRTLGFVFQSFNLLPRTTALENVELPLIYGGVRARERRRLARQALERVGLGDRVHHHPNQLSGGQQQRVAIARALCMNPNIMLFDEPTSALDPEMVKEVLDTMVELASDGITMLVVSHEMGFARQVADRVILMDDGQVVEVSPPKDFFGNPRHERTRLFLQQIIH